MTTIQDVSKLSKQIVAEVERAIVGKRDLLDMIMASALAGGHVLLEDYPGLGKTLIARSFATALGLKFKRPPPASVRSISASTVASIRRLSSGSNGDQLQTAENGCMIGDRRGGEHIIEAFDSGRVGPLLRWRFL